MPVSLLPRRRLPGKEGISGRTESTSLIGRARGPSLGWRRSIQRTLGTWEGRSWAGKAGAAWIQWLLSPGMECLGGSRGRQGQRR